MRESDRFEPDFNTGERQQCKSEAKGIERDGDKRVVTGERETESREAETNTGAKRLKMVTMRARQRHRRKIHCSDTVLGF